MRKYNRKILTALVMAYKKGLINIKPLQRWISIKQNLYHIVKYLIYIALFVLVILLIEFNFLPDLQLDKYIYLGKIFISRARIIKGIVYGFIGLNLYQLGKYVTQVYYVRWAMKHYDMNANNIEILNRVTFKITV